MTEREPLTTDALAGMGRVRFEVEPCGRCGGSGRYSFNLIHGSVCYGCGGQGKRRTAAAKRAAKKLEALKPEVAIEDLIDGDQVFYTYGNRRLWFTVETGVESRSARVVDGVAIPDISVRLVRGEKHMVYSAPEGAMLRRPFTPAEYAEYLELARSLKGAYVEEG